LVLDGPIKCLHTPFNHSAIKIKSQFPIETLKVSNPGFSLKMKFNKLNITHLTFRDFNLGTIQETCLLPNFLVSLTLELNHGFWPTMLDKIEFPDTLLWLSLLTINTYSTDEDAVCNYKLPENLEILVVRSYKKHRSLRKIYSYDPLANTYVRNKNLTILRHEFGFVYDLDTEFLPLKLKAFFTEGNSIPNVPPIFFEKMEYLSVSNRWLDAIRTVKVFSNLVSLSIMEPIEPNETFDLVQIVDNSCPKLVQLLFSTEIGEALAIRVPIVPELYVHPMTNSDIDIYRDFFAENDIVRLKFVCSNGTVKNPQVISVFIAYSRSSGTIGSPSEDQDSLSTIGTPAQNNNPATHYEKSDSDLDHYAIPALGTITLKKNKTQFYNYYRVNVVVGEVFYFRLNNMS
jgi:hypothetical protein